MHQPTNKQTPNFSHSDLLCPPQLFRPFTYEQTRPLHYTILNAFGQEVCTTHHPKTAALLVSLLNKSSPK